MDLLKPVLKPIASLRLTVALLLIAMVLVLAGTTAQRDMGMQDVLKHFFHTPYYAKIYLHYFEPTPKTGANYRTGNMWFPLPGGYLLIGLLLANLLAAHTVRFKFTWKRTGIILIHFGLILLLVGEVLTGTTAVESRMRIDEGSWSDYSADVREGHSELAFIDGSPADHDNVVVVPQGLLEKSAANGQPIKDATLPVDIKVERWYDNSLLHFPMEAADSKIDRLATAGSDSSLGLEKITKYNGTESATDIPGAFVTFSKDGKSLGTYLVTSRFDYVMGDDPMPMLRNRPLQTLTVDGKTYKVALRFERYYKPYKVYLKKFTHDRFRGTDVAKDFASDIELVDPDRHADRTAHICMNEPLRYSGNIFETFYQADFDHAHDKYTILQVVHNQAWLMPYLACTIGAIGLILHFGMTLIRFLSKRLEQGDTVLPYLAVGKVGLLIWAFKRVFQSDVPPSPKTTRPKKIDARRDTSFFPNVLAALVTIIFVAVLASVALKPAPAPTTSEFDYSGFGTLPILFEGRVQPLNSLAINSVKVISGKQTPHDENGNAIPVEKWLLDVMTRNDASTTEKVIRIDHPQIKTMLGLPESEKMFSWQQIFKNEENYQKIDKQSNLANEKADKDRDAYDNQMLELKTHLNVYLRFFQVDSIAARYDYIRDPQRARLVMQLISEALSTQDPKFLERLRAAPAEDGDSILRQAMSRLDFNKLTQEQQAAVGEWFDQMRRTRQLEQMNSSVDLYLSAPSDPGKDWEPLRAAIEGPNAPASAASFLKIIADYRDNRKPEFNRDVAAYHDMLEKNLPGSFAKIDTERFFNRLDPFYLSMVFYVLVFLMAIFSWLAPAHYEEGVVRSVFGWWWSQRALWRAAFALICFVWLLHTAGLGIRVYLSGHPPITNLYSSAVFIAWGMILFAIGIEAVFRNGIGMAAASAAGFASLLVAAGLSAGEGDTMKQLVAVLNTNFWLATHVVCVTLGYTATFVAGAVAIVYLLGISTTLFTPGLAKDVARIVYGIICFAMFFSFVGTILGGIWADQSWGRFWGWDPKENGAVLIVLWNAMILHARWGGLVQAKGVAVLAVLGNIVTSWSWFGTNMLGIGLHSYGFMDSAQFYLAMFMLANVVLAVFGMLPWKGAQQSSGNTGRGFDVPLTGAAM